MKATNDISKELNSLSPLLGRLKSEVSPLQAPDGYLEAQLPVAIWQKIDHAREFNNKPRVLQMILGLSAAAAVLLAVTLTVKFSVDPVGVSPVTLYASNGITQDDIISYLMDNTRELDEIDIATGLEIITENPILPEVDIPAVNAWLEEYIDVLDEDLIADEYL